MVGTEQRDAPVVPVTGGRIRGRELDGVVEFAGIPYARAPLGPLRWRPPEPPEPWDGVRAAVDFGPIAPQSSPLTSVAIPGDPDEQSEDCLSLNVATPGLDGRRPVLVWIHGGGFTGGTGASALYRGGHLARTGDVVVVTCNYRLGALGFLGHPALAEGAGGQIGNFGLADQVAVLRWVQRHIASFGGDPDSVTVLGESAGAMSVCALLAMPVTQGLFRRAVIESGPGYTHTVGRATEAAEELCRELGLAGVTRQALEGVPADELVAAQQVLQARRPRPAELPLPFLPVVDGVVLPRHPLEAAAAGAARGIDVLLGTNRDEMTFFTITDPEFFAMDQTRLVKRLNRSAPDADVAQVTATYERVLRARGEATTPSALWVAAGTDLVFRRPTWALADALVASGGRAFVYLFTYETPVLGGVLGSCHALEVPFVFGTYVDPRVSPFVGSGPAVDHLAEQIQQRWLAFARTGDPSDPGLPGDAWERWDPVRRPVMVLGPGDELGVSDGYRSDELAVWDGSTVAGGSEVRGDVSGVVT